MAVKNHVPIVEVIYPLEEILEQIMELIHLFNMLLVIEKNFVKRFNKYKMHKQVVWSLKEQIVAYKVE